MPFSFKPEISQEGSPDPATPSTTASFGSQAENLMTRVGGGEGHSIVTVLLMTAAGLTALVTVGVAGYSFFLSSQIESKKASLASFETRLAGLPLEDMRKLSNRMKLINQLVKEHPSVNVAFRILEDSVENQVTYTSFDLRYNESAKSYQLQLRAVAPNYRGVAQQVDTYKRKPYTNYIPSVTVESLAPNDMGGIEFMLKMPITIAGLLPEGINLSDGAAARVASSTLEDLVTTETASSTVASSSTPAQ